MQFRRIMIGVVLIACPVGGAAADEVTDWNNVLLGAIRTAQSNAPTASRAIAMVNVAMFDAVNSINMDYEPYHTMEAPPVGAIAQLAAAGAAYQVLIALYPDQTATFDAALAAAQVEVSDIFGLFKQSSVDFGKSIGTRIVELRANDNSTATASYTPGTGAGQWQPTPPGNLPALLPSWPGVTPWALVTGSQLRQSGPPQLTSARYTTDFNEVKTLGASTGSTRTDDQTQIAQFWADGAGTATTPGHWIAIAITIAEAEGTSLNRNSRLFALLGISLADAAIAAWDNKYAFDHWRPITAIRGAADDTNPNTAADPAWDSLIAAPPFPSYTSGHSTFSGAASKILELFFRTDAIGFSMTSDGLPGVTRSYTSLSQAANEAGRSRVYGGTNFNHDNLDGLATGRELAAAVFGSLLTLVPVTTTSSSSGLCGASGGLGLLMLTLMFVGPARRMLRPRRAS